MQRSARGEQQATKSKQQTRKQQRGTDEHRCPDMMVGGAWVGYSLNGAAAMGDGRGNQLLTNVRYIRAAGKKGHETPTRSHTAVNGRF